jgi:hypothetical protein
VCYSPFSKENPEMADPRRNAEQLKARITTRLKELEDEKAGLSKQLTEVTAFLKTLDAYSSIDPEAVSAPATVGSATGSRKRPVNPPREQVLEVVAEALERAGRPMQLRELFEAVGQAGIDLQGTDPSAVLGTMVWRARKRFANVKGYGYWFADRPYSAAGYFPERTE